MGIDYYLINKTNKEYVWLGRMDPTCGLSSYGTILNEEMLDACREERVLMQFEWSFEDDPDNELILRLLNYEALFNYYFIIKNYIKGCECFVKPDTCEDLHLEHLRNNMDLEDQLFDDCGIYSMFELCEDLV